jgi:hypothetical protein
VSTSSQWHARSALGGGHFSDRDISRTDVPPALSTILVNLRQHDVLASERSDGQSVYETSTGTLTSHSVEFLQAGAISERERAVKWEGCAPSILSFTLSPISFIHSLT